MSDDAVRLRDFSKDEWRDVARRLRPEWTDEEFEQAWNEFAEVKRRKTLS